MLCVRVQAETPWIDADSLKETVGLGNEWDEWQPEEIEGWKYIEIISVPFFPWSNWIYHLDHGWLYPVVEDLGSIWFYSLKLNNNWIWTSQNHFDFFFIHKSADSTFMTKIPEESFIMIFRMVNGCFGISFQICFPLILLGSLNLHQRVWFLFHKARSTWAESDKGEQFTDTDNDGKFDSGEPFEDSNGNGEYDGQQGYDDEYPQHVVDLSPFYVSQFEVTNQLWDQVLCNGLSHALISQPWNEIATYTSLIAWSMLMWLLSQMLTENSRSQMTTMKAQVIVTVLSMIRSLRL